MVKGRIFGDDRFDLRACTPPAQQGDAAESATPSRSSITDLSDAFASVAQHVKPAVVLVQSQRVQRVKMQRGPIRLRLRVAQGSGFLASSDGYILTNNHLVAGADRVTLRLARAPTDVKPDGDPIY